MSDQPAALEDTDPITVVRSWLIGHPETPQILGHPAEAHISGQPETPWPHLAIDLSPGGVIGDTVRAVTHELTFTLDSHPDGSPGKQACWRAAMRLARILRQLPDDQVITPATPVVSRVYIAGTPAYQALSNGQHRFVLTGTFTISPPPGA